jgi:hypothetical protein
VGPRAGLDVVETRKNVASNEAPVYLCGSGEAYSRVRPFGGRPLATVNLNAQKRLSLVATPLQRNVKQYKARTKEGERPHDCFPGKGRV